MNKMGGLAIWLFAALAILLLAGGGGDDYGGCQRRRGLYEDTGCDQQCPIFSGIAVLAHLH